MKRITRSVFAVIAAITLLFINIGAFSIQAFALEDANTWNTAPSWSNEPTWKTPPKWESSKGKSSGWNTQPTWKTSPDWSSPGWEQSPDWKNSGWENQPSWDNQPNWQTPEWENESPWGNQPNWNAPNWMNPEWNELPDQKNDNSHVNPPTSPNGNQPNVQGNPDSTNTPNDNTPQDHEQITYEKDNNNGKNNQNSKPQDSLDDPFFGFKDVTGKGAASYIVKNIVGGNIKLIDKSLRNGDLTLKDYLKSRKDMGFSGFKLFTRGDPTVDALYDGYDLLKKPKDIYDKYKIFKDVKKVDDLRKSGDLIEYARKSKELYETGKSFSTGNTVVSAITMPFTIWDTVDNVKKLNNAKTSDEKTDATWGLVDNAGSLLTGVAPFVAMIPGAQPIAAGMVVVGVAISAVSLGRKLWKNRKEIADNVVKKAKKVGKWFKSLFKG